MTLGLRGVGGATLLESFAPTDIAGLVLWLDSVDTTTILNSGGTAATDGQDVATWLDKSSAGNDLSQSTATQRPVFRSTGSDLSTPCIDFDDVVNGTHLDVATGSIQTTGNTCFMVFAHRSGGGTGRILLSGGNANGQLIAEAGAAGSGTSVGMNAPGAALPETYDYNTPAVGTFQFNGAVSNAWKNGVANAGNPGNPGTATSLGIAVGALRTGAGPVLMEMGSLLVYNSVLSTANRQAVEAYLTARYSI